MFNIYIYGNMNMETKQYTGRETFQLLLHRDSACAVVDDWVARNIQSDLRIRRAKTRGHVVIETRDVLFARNIQMYHPDCKVNIIS